MRAQAWLLTLVVSFHGSRVAADPAETEAAPPTARFADQPVAEEQQDPVAAPAQPVAPSTPPPQPVFMPGPAPRDALPAKAAASDWYGEQVLLLDAAAVVTLVAAPPLGFFTYLLGGPIVHGAHGNPGTAAGSLGLRIALPLVGAGLMTESQHECAEDDPGLCGYNRGMAGLAGAGLGAIIASIIDIAFLSYDDVEPAPPSLRASASVGFGKNGLYVGFGGSF